MDILERIKQERSKSEVCDLMIGSKRLTIIDHSCRISGESKRENSLDLFDVILPIKMDLLENEYLKDFIEFVNPVICMVINIEQNRIESVSMDYYVDNDSCDSQIKFNNSKYDQDLLNSFLLQTKEDIFVDVDKHNNKIEKKVEGLFNEINREKNNDFIKHLNRLESKIDGIGKNQFERVQEKSFQKLLVKFPQIIESDLKFLDEYYKLGNSNWEGDILFLDSNNRKLNVELKVIVFNYREFRNQLFYKYIKNIDITKERIMYIAPKITDRQREYCIKHNIEMKEIDLNSILKI